MAGDSWVLMKTDAELMTSYMPAEEIIIVPKKFTAFKDGSAHPAVIFLDDEGVLHAVGGQQGIRQKANLSQAYRISFEVVDFVLRQADDGTVSLAIATLEGGSKGGLYLFFGLTADEIWSPPSDKLVKGDNLPGITKVFMTHTTSYVDGLGDVPALLFSHTDSERVNETTVSPILVTPAGGGTLKVDEGWKLSTNASEIHDIEFGSSAFGAGAFVLYTDHESNKRVIYQVTEPDESSSDSGDEGDPFLCDFYVDNDATHIVTYIDPKNTTRSVLLVIGSKITMYESNQYVKRHPEKAAVVTIGTLVDVKTIHVAQSTDKGYTDHITIWYVNKQGAAYYYRTTHADFENGSSVQILPRGSCDHISATLWELSEQETLVQTLVSFNKNNGKYDIWYQGLNTGFWDRHPMYADTRTTNMEVQGYTARFQPVTDSGGKFPNADVHFSLDSTSLIYIHGKPEWVGLEGKWVQADATGTIEIFVPAHQLDGHAALIDKVRPKDTGTEQAVYMEWEHLCDKPAAKLRDYQTVDQLRNARSQSGKKVIPDSMSGDLLNQIADGVSMGFNVYDDIAASASAAREAVTTPEEHALLMRKRVQFSSSCAEDLKNLGNAIVDGVEWAWGKIEKIAEGAWHVIVTVVEQEIKFIIDTAKKAWQFISKVVDAIEMVVDMLIDWLGMLFNWGDITTTAKSIHRWIDASLYWGAAKVDSLEELVDDIFDNIIDKLEDTRGKQLTQSSDPPKDPGGFEDQTHSVQFNYGIDKLLKYTPGGSSSMAIKLVGGPDTIVAAADQGIVQVVWDALQNILNDMKDLINSVFKDVTDWEEWAKSPLEVLKRVDCDVAIGVVKLIRDVVDAMIKAVGAIIRNFQSWGDYELDIPILTPLWKGMTQQNLSLFGAFSFAMAFPTYFIAKTITGNAPPDLSDMPIDQWMNTTSFSAASSLAAHSSTTDLYNFLGFSGVAAGLIAPTVFLVLRNLDAVKAAVAYEIRPGLNLVDLILLGFQTLTSLSPIALRFKAKGSVDPFWPKVSWVSDLASGGIFGSCILLRFCLGGSIPHDTQSVVVDVSNLFVSFVGTAAKIWIIEEEWNEIDGFEKGAEITKVALMLAGNGCSVFADMMNEAEQPEIGGPASVVALGLKLTGALAAGYELYHDHEPS